MRVCYFGTYEKDYPRNRIVIQGLREQGVDVVECHYPLWERHTDKTGSYLSPLSLFRIVVRLFVAYAVLLRQFMKIGDFDFLMVGYIGQADVFLARVLLIFRRKPMVFNPLVSLYDTLVMDRGIFKRGGLLSKVLFGMDRWAFRLSDLILFDTDEHVRYISELFEIAREKFVRVLVGADEHIFYPRKETVRDQGRFRVLFYGKCTPLHGMHHILDAAKALEREEEIRFRIIGKGQLSERIQDQARQLRLKNTEFVDWVAYEALPDYIAEADVCLGIFGDTDKAKRVIPNKVFQILACGKPVITADTPAIHELGAVDGLRLCSSGNGESLGNAIRSLKAEKRKMPVRPYLVATAEAKTLLRRMQDLHRKREV